MEEVGFEVEGEGVEYGEVGLRVEVRMSEVKVWRRGRFYGRGIKGGDLWEESEYLGFWWLEIFKF